MRLRSLGPAHEKRASRAILAAIGIYCIWSVLLMLQEPGLQYDEAFLVAGAVHMLHPAGEYTLAQAGHVWACAFRHCIPLMGGGSRYVGAIKDYLALPLFALFGPRTILIRLLSMALGAVGIWGVSKLVAARMGPLAAASVALIMAFHPAYAAMTVFDNNAIGAMMAGLGLSCAALAFYLQRRSVAAAALFGLALGFAIWNRANFVWVPIAGGIAAIIVFRSRFRAPASHWRALVFGGVAGGLPFLIFQVVSKAATWRESGSLTTSMPRAELSSYRLFMLREIFLSDGEHRRMWAGPDLPAWQMWFFPIVVAAACLVCLAVRPQTARLRRADAQFTALITIILAAYMVLTRMTVAEHHLIILVPFAAAAVVMACSIIQSGFRPAWMVAASLALIYAGSAIHWQISAIEGLKKTHGVGMWSSGLFDLARHIDDEYRGRPIKILDWGLQANLFVLTDGRLLSDEIFSSATDRRSRRDVSWNDEVREGGVFLLNGPGNRIFPKSSEGFLRAVAENQPVLKSRYAAGQRDGTVCAELIAISTNSSHSMRDVRWGEELRGFHQIEEGTWRWTSRRFSVSLPVPDPASPDPARRSAELSVQLYIPEVSIQKLGPITLTARVGSHVLPPETYRATGGYTFRRRLSRADLSGTETPSGDAVRIEFALDKALPPTGVDRRELGIIVSKIVIEPIAISP